MSHVKHWDDMTVRTRESGHIGGEWEFLSDETGSVGIGAKRVRIPPGKWSTPVHVHGSEEEIFYVLGGTGLSWQDGKTYAIGEGDCIVHTAGAEAHSIRAGDDGLEFVVFGQRLQDVAALLPRAGVFWLGAKWVEAGDDRHPWQRELAAGEPECPEPETERVPWIANLAAVEDEERRGATVARRKRDLGSAVGSVQVGLRWYQPDPGMLAVPPHCHSAEEELFVVLDGDGACLLGDEEHPVRRGSVVARPPGTGVAHTFRAGPDGLSYLAFGTREPNDICFYPRSGKISFRGVGVIGRLERLDYWDGED